MADGYLVAAAVNLGAAREIAPDLGLDVIGASDVSDAEATSAALAGAPKVAILLSAAAGEDPSFVALMHVLAQRLQQAQLLLVHPDAGAAFSFLPENWPAYLVKKFQSGARLSFEMIKLEGGLRGASPSSSGGEAGEQPPEEGAPETLDGGTAPAPTEPAKEEEEPSRAIVTESGAPRGGATETSGATRDDAPPPAPAQQPAPAQPVPAQPAPAPQPRPSAPPSVAPPSATPDRSAQPAGRARSEARPSALADATAFAPRKLRRGTPELVRVAVHQPKDLAAVVKAARKVDRRSDPAPSGMRIGDVPLGSSVGVSLDVRGGACDGALQRRTWTGDPLDFNFSVEADGSVEQAVFLARVFVDDAQIGVLAFTRRVSGPAKKAADVGDKVRLKRHKRVFLSYSSEDRATVSAIATAYAAAGVEHFWDRASLKPGEEWSPRLRREIERADLFHLCWSKSAAASEWVEKEAEYALTRRHNSNGKRPDITVQMLDGPPWAPHPRHLDAINFDDFVRAAIVGYARGDGS